MSNVPFNTAPVEGRPWDAGAGVENAQNWLMQQQQKKHALEQMYIQNQQSNANLDRYTQQTPHEVQVSGLRGAQAQAEMPYVQDHALGVQGRNRVDQVRGRQAMDTEATGTAATNMGNTIKALEGAARHLEMTAAQSPMFGQAEYQRFREALPEQVRKTFPPNYSPDTPKMIQSLSQMLTNSPQHRGAMELETTRRDSAERVARGNNQTSENVAGINADARMAAAWARIGGGSAAQHKVETIVNQYLQMIMDNKEPTPQQEKAYLAAQQIMMNVRAAAGLPMDPNALKQQLLFPGQQPPPRPVPQPVQPIPPAQPSGGGAVGRWNPNTRKVEPLGR
jgi:hypothetical protein